MPWPKGLVRLHAHETAAEARARIALAKQEERERAALARVMKRKPVPPKPAPREEAERMSEIVAEFQRMGTLGPRFLDDAIVQAEERLAFYRRCRAILFPAAEWSTEARDWVAPRGDGAVSVYAAVTPNGAVAAASAAREATDAAMRDPQFTTGGK